MSTNGHRVILESYNTVVSTNSTGGGIAYLDRKLDIEKRNIFRFQIRQSERQDIWIGLEEMDTSKVWIYRVMNGMKTDQRNGPVEYTNLRAKNGSIIEMIVEDEVVRYILNGKDLGVAFRDERIKKDNVFALVFVHMGEEVKLLNGEVRPINRLQ